MIARYIKNQLTLHKLYKSGEANQGQVFCVDLSYKIIIML